jgi:S1/P1 Nuclease
MKRLPTVFLAAAITAVRVAPAWAWNDAGHMLVAQIAWDNMTPAARANAIRLLRSANADTRLVFPLGVGMLNSLEQQQQFLHAAIWPDSMRKPGSTFRTATS